MALCGDGRVLHRLHVRHTISLARLHEVPTAVVVRAHLRASRSLLALTSATSHMPSHLSPATSPHLFHDARAYPGNSRNERCSVPSECGLARSRERVGSTTERLCRCVCECVSVRDCLGNSSQIQFSSCPCDHPQHLHRVFALCGSWVDGSGRAPANQSSSCSLCREQRLVSGRLRHSPTDPRCWNSRHLHRPSLSFCVGGGCWGNATPYDDSLASLHVRVGEYGHAEYVDRWSIPVLCSRLLFPRWRLCPWAAPIVSTTKHPRSTPSPSSQWHSYASSQLVRTHIMDMPQTTNTYLRNT